MQSTLSKEAKDNTRYLFRALKASYTTKFKAMYPSDEDLHVAMQLWTLKTCSYSREELDQALLNLVETCHWVPSLAEFLAELKMNRARQELMNAKVTIGNSSMKRTDKRTAMKNLNRLRDLIAAARICGHDET